MIRWPNEKEKFKEYKKPPKKEIKTVSDKQKEFMIKHYITAPCDEDHDKKLIGVKVVDNCDEYDECSDCLKANTQAHLDRIHKLKRIDVECGELTEYMSEETCDDNDDDCMSCMTTLYDRHFRLNAKDIVAIAKEKKASKLS